MVDANILESSNDEEQKSSNSDGGLPLTLNKSSTKKRGRPRGSKSLGITALKKKNRKTKVDDDQVLGFRLKHRIITAQNSI